MSSSRIESKLPLEVLEELGIDHKPVIVMSEGNDPRVINGALAAYNKGVCQIVLLGSELIIKAEFTKLDVDLPSGVKIIDPEKSELLIEFEKEYFNLRKKKGISIEEARSKVKEPLNFAALMVRLGHAAGTVGGAVETTSTVVRAAIQLIGKSDDAQLISSCFLMYPKGAYPMVYSDCGLVIDPTEDELASIAVMAADSCKNLLLTDPRVAMLSFSTKGSATHPKASKVIKATKIVRSNNPEIEIDGELQFDAAISPEIAQTKAKGSPTAGTANVMVFPNLDAGNIGYKITQRLGGAEAIGPILQGLVKPANDLSRGCSANDVAQMIAVTVLQANRI
jgi:phosphate acetyltransferase